MHPKEFFKEFFKEFSKEFPKEFYMHTHAVPQWTKTDELRRTAELICTSVRLNKSRTLTAS